jgi:hypothetical protein
VFPMAQHPPVGQDFLTIEASLQHAVIHAAFAKHPLDEWSAWRRDLYLTTHNNHKREIPIPPAGFESPIPESERQQTHVLEGVATIIRIILNVSYKRPVNTGTKLPTEHDYLECSCLTCL